MIMSIPATRSASIGRVWGTRAIAFVSGPPRGQLEAVFTVLETVVKMDFSELPRAVTAR